MNRKGFTLIELLTVFVILGIIAVIAIPTITSSMQRNKERHDVQRIKLLESSAESYVNDHKNEFFPFLYGEDSVCYVKIQTLIDGNYLNDDLVKRVDEDKSFSGTVKVSGGSVTQYKYTDDEVNDSDLCTTRIPSLNDPNNPNNGGSGENGGNNEGVVSVNVTFYYNDGGPKKISRKCTINDGASSCGVDIPDDVKNSKGPYQSNYIGLANGVRKMQLVANSDKSSVEISRKNNQSSISTVFFALYQKSVTEYYNNGTDGVSRVLYRNEYFDGVKSIGTVLSDKSDGVKNLSYDAGNGVGGSVFKGYSESNSTTVVYNSIGEAARSNTSVLYSVYGMNVEYRKGVHVDSIGATSGSCLMKYGDTSCSVIAPTIGASVGYVSVGWGNSSGATSGTAAGQNLSVSNNNSVYYGNGKRDFTCGSKGSTMTYAGKNWYVIDNSNGKCNLALNEVSTTSGSYNDASTNLYNEYFKAGSTLRNDLDAGLIESYDSNSGLTTEKLSGNYIYWNNSGSAYLSYSLDNVTLNGAQLLYYSFDTGTGSGIYPKSGNYIIGYSNSPLSAKTYSNLNNNSNVFKTLNRVKTASTITGSQYFKCFKPSEGTNNSVKLHRVSYYLSKSNVQQNDYVSGSDFNFNICGGGSYRIYPKSSSQYNTSNAYHGFNTDFHYCFAGIIEFSSSANSTVRTYNFNLSGPNPNGANCDTYYTYTTQSYTTYIYYRLRINVVI